LSDNGTAAGVRPLAEHSRTLDAAYREVGGRLAVNTEVSVHDDGKFTSPASRPSRSRRR